MQQNNVIVINQRDLARRMFLHSLEGRRKATVCDANGSAGCHLNYRTEYLNGYALLDEQRDKLELLQSKQA